MTAISEAGVRDDRCLSKAIMALGQNLKSVEARLQHHIENLNNEVERASLTRLQKRPPPDTTAIHGS